MLTWREKVRYFLLGASTIVGGGYRKAETLEEYVARVDRATNDPEQIEKRKNLKPAFYYSRTTGKITYPEDRDV